MEARELLKRLPPPDPSGEARVWRRFQETRRGQERQRFSLTWVLPPLVAAAAVALYALLPEREREIVLDASTDVVRYQWSDQVQLRLAGHGTATGTARDVVVNWETGTVWVEVEPNSGSSLSVLTDEAEIRVVGTAFSVTRDALGVTTAVERGRVQVTCDDGWSGMVTPETGAHTCLPIRPGALKARADALLALGASEELVLATLDRGLAVAEEGSSFQTELLAARVEVLARMGRVDEAEADALRYLALAESRRAEVSRAVATALLVHGCERALPWLERVGEDGTAQDDVMLASCLMTSDPARALALVKDALQSGQELEPEWRAWAQAQVDGGGR